MMQNFTPNEKTKTTSKEKESFSPKVGQQADQTFEKELFKALDETLLEPSESIIKKILAYSKR